VTLGLPAPFVNYTGNVTRFLIHATLSKSFGGLGYTKIRIRVSGPPTRRSGRGLERDGNGRHDTLNLDLVLYYIVTCLSKFAPWLPVASPVETNVRGDY